MKVFFAHGKESGPWGDKILALAEVARAMGAEVESPDYSEFSAPDDRVKLLMSLCREPGVTLVLVGSSMGGYVSTVASRLLEPAGIFLMAPAFYLPGYQVQDPIPVAGKTMVVHGWSDAVVPVEHSIRFARSHGADLHLVASDHRLSDQIPLLCSLFSLFLGQIATRQRAR
jgi:alpha-beta hydrolase superfamily lysophospholipase